MKLKEGLTILLIISLVYFSINKKTIKETKVTIAGKITNPRGESVSFINQDTSYSTTTNKNGAFSISFDLDSATYLRFEHGPEGTAMYVNPGDKIDLTIDTESFDETIKYRGSPSSSFLAKKYLLEERSDYLGEVYYMSSTQEYKTYLESIKNSIIDEFGDVNDSKFINSEVANIDRDIEYFIGRQEKLSQYSNDVRSYMWETSEISRAFNFYAALDSLNTTEFKYMTEQYTQSYQSSLNRVTNEEFLATAKERITKTTNRWIEMKTAVDNMPKEGQPAINFNYPDIDGNNVSLSNLKGKLVYVDVWATWCGPCRAEIPSLQKLEVDYHERDVTFLSVSVDQDKEAWRKMVADEELGGIQLWADGWSKITKDYAIFGIPRFMLFDTKGNIISTNAPRPSSDSIRELLDANL